MCARDTDFHAWISADVAFHTAIYIGLAGIEVLLNHAHEDVQQVIGQ